MKRRIFAAALLAVGIALGAGSNAEAREFRYASANDILGLDPHANNHGVTNAMKLNVYETLVLRLPDGSLTPSLASEWSLVNPTTWRIRLRQNVRFHGGENFTADDVIFSWQRVRQQSSDMAYTVVAIDAINKIDDHTIDIVTKGPTPTLLQDLSLFFIMSKAWVERHNAMDVVRTAGASNYVNLNTNGTGPFRVIERVINERTVLEPNPNWWGQANHGITRATYRQIANAATRVAALLSGEIDLIWPVPLQDIDRVRGSANTRITDGPTGRTIYFGFDMWRDESLDMPGTGRNPFKDVRVRQAVYHAIDIQAIRRAVMRNTSRPTGLFIGPAIAGFQQDLDERLPFNVDRARQLLTEAGYPNGFTITLHCPNNRYINDEAICTAVVPMLARAGINARLMAQPMTQHINQISLPNNNTSFYMLGWTPGNFDISNPLLELLTSGSFNIGRYNNPRLAELRQLIVNETDAQKRTQLIREALTIFRTDLPLVPLHQEPQVFGVGQNVEDFVLHMQEDVRLSQVRMRR